MTLRRLKTMGGGVKGWLKGDLWGLNGNEKALKGNEEALRGEEGR